MSTEIKFNIPTDITNKYNMFLDNKYTKIYYKIINNAINRTINGYVERHHIIPKCLGGNNDPSNIVPLTAREHFICHRLLTKMVEGINKRKLVFAAWQLSRSAKYHNVKITSKTYNSLRQQLSESQIGIKKEPFSDEARANMRKGAKNRKKVIYTEERLAKLRLNHENNRGKINTEEYKKKMSETLKGRIFSQETKEKISISKIGKRREPFTEETKKKMSAARQRYLTNRQD